MNIYLFPLPDTVILPGMSRPLNIFEPRYIEMVYDSVSKDIPVAIGHGKRSSLSSKLDLEIDHESLTHVKRVAGFGKFEIIQKREDGSLLVIYKCLGKVYLEKQSPSANSYITCHGRELLEQYEVSTSSAFMYKRLYSLFHDKLSETIKGKKQRDIILAEISGPSQLVTYYTDFIVDKSSVKQAVLECEHIDEKILILSHFNLNSHKSQLLEVKS